MFIYVYILLCSHCVYLTRCLLQNTDSINPFLKKYEFTAIKNTYKDVVDKCDGFIINGVKSMFTMHAPITIPQHNKGRKD